MSFGPPMRGGFRPPFGGRPNLNHWNMNRAPRMRPNGFRPQGQGPPMNNPGYGGPQRPMMGPPMGVGNIEQFHLDDFPHPSLTPDDVMVWIDEQHPSVIRNIMFHCRWALQQRGIPIEEVSPDMSAWYADGGMPGPGMKRPPQENFLGGPDAKRRGQPGLGWQRPMQPGNLQWTPAGWVAKDNSHKITTTMKPLPEPDVIPPNGSANYPEAAADRDKLKMLSNNLNMMTFELTKICKTHKIIDFDKEKMSLYPEEAHSRLQTAVTCVEKAEQTLKEFKEFLKTEKYKDWNEEQVKKHEAAVKQMIGAMPSGVPHNSRQASKPEPQQEQEGEEESGDEEEDDDDDDEEEEETNAE